MIESFNAKSQKLGYYEVINISEIERADNRLDPKYRHLNP